MTTIIGTPTSAPYTGATTEAIPRPVRVRRKRLISLADMVDHLLRVEDINAGEDRSVERAVLACKAAIDDFAAYSPQGFKYLEGRAQIVLGAAVTVGEVSVSSGVVTPTVAPSWPSWMDFANFRINDSTYQILGYDSTTATVDESLADGTYTGTSVEQVYSRLPHDFRCRGSLTDGEDEYSVVDQPGGVVQSWQDYYDWGRSAANPRTFGAITGDERFQGELLLAIWPPYTDRKVLSLFYERYPAPVEIHRFSGSGTLTVGITNSTVTASGSVFTSDHIGSQLVVCTGNNTDIESPLASEGLIYAKRVIVSVESGTSCTIDEDIGDAITTRTFYISDVVDVLKGPMSEALFALARFKFLERSHTKSEFLNKAKWSFDQAIRLALTDDARYRDSVDDTPVSYGYSLGDVTGRPS